jgi:NhaP-type Na+/H+ or K+/H+ antiporter
MFFYHYIDAITFLMATAVLLVGAGYMNIKKPITVLVIMATGVYLVAQSTWFSSWMSQNHWGRDFSNYIWFLFNTLTMVIFAWTLLDSKK